MHLRVELEALDVMDDLPHASNRGGERQEHPDHDAEDVDEPRQAVLLGLLEHHPDDAGDEVGGGREAEPAEEPQQAVEEGEGHADEHGGQDVGGACDEPEPEARGEPELLHQHRLHHVEHRHGEHLVAADDVDGHHEVGRRDEPPRLLQADEHVGVHRVTEGVVAGEGDGEVAERDDGVGHHHPAPHGLLGRLLRGGRDGGLDLQHHVVAGVGERDGAQRVEHAEHLARRGGRPERVVGGGSGVGALGRGGEEGDHGVGKRHDGGGGGDSGDGVEVGELRERELDGGEDHDPEGEADVLAPAVAEEVVHLLERLPAGDHVDDVGADLDDELLRDDDPEPEALPEGVLPELVVPVEALPGHHLVHLHHLPQRVDRDAEGADDGHRPGAPPELRHGEGQAQHAGAHHRRHVVEGRVVPLGGAGGGDGEPVVEARVPEPLLLLPLVHLLHVLLHQVRHRQRRHLRSFFSFFFAVAGRPLGGGA
jgi:hypothetical protein